MSLSIRTNIASLNAQRNLSSSQGAAETAMSHLSSGMRITKAGDDAAGLAISTRLQAQVKSFNQVARNINDGLSLIQTAEQSLNTTSNMLTRIRELAVQASTGTAENDITTLQDEANDLMAEIDRAAGSAKFNGVNLLDGTAGTAGKVAIQVGIDDGDTIDVDLSTDMHTDKDLGFSATTFTWAKGSDASGDLQEIDDAITAVSDQRAKLGSTGNRLQSTLDNVQTFSESLSAANSRIRDVDVAEETANLAKANVLQQAGISVLAQANQQPQMALKLLG